MVCKHGLDDQNSLSGKSGDQSPSQNEKIFRSCLISKQAILPSSCLYLDWGHLKFQQIADQQYDKHTDQLIKKLNVYCLN